MARRRRGARRVLSIALVLGAVWAYRRCGAPIAERLGLGYAHGPRVSDVADGDLRVATWNLHNFPTKGQDTAAVAATLQELDAAVVGVQELRDPSALTKLLPKHRVVASERGGSGGQRVGFVYDPRQVRLVAGPREDGALSLGGRLRPMLLAHFARVPDGLDVIIGVVHLKARPSGLDQRRRQWPLLVEGIRTAQHAWSDDDVILLGDFNSTGAEGASDAQAELRELRQVLGSASLSPKLPVAGCSAYWEGSRRDAWKEPSLLDHIWLAGFAESDTQGLESRAAGPCAQYGCQALRSTRRHPEPLYHLQSDHCPIVIDLPATRDDDPRATPAATAPLPQG